MISTWAWGTFAPLCSGTNCCLPLRLKTRPSTSRKATRSRVASSSKSAITPPNHGCPTPATRPGARPPSISPMAGEMLGLPLLVGRNGQIDLHSRFPLVKSCELLYTHQRLCDQGGAVPFSLIPTRFLTAMTRLPPSPSGDGGAFAVRSGLHPGAPVILPARPGAAPVAGGPPASQSQSSPTTAPPGGRRLSAGC